MKHLKAKSAQSVQEALHKANLSCQVLELPTSTRSAADAAASIGCNIAQIVKSLVFKTQNTAKPILILVSGSNKVDERMIASLVGEEIVKADADFVRAVTGFAIGGVPPMGHKTAIDLIYLDKDLLLLDEVWAAAGTPNAVFCIQAQDLMRITNAKLISITD